MFERILLGHLADGVLRDAEQDVLVVRRMS
jgi:hypothetical protein